MREIAGGLRFPEGPIALEDGSILLVEIERCTLSRVTHAGEIEVVAHLGGGPNGAALGPDGAVYVCNNGGFKWRESDGRLFPNGTPDDYSGGRIERVELTSGRVDVLYRECEGHPLRGPNDIVFDQTGGFWFTDLGKTHGRVKHQGGLYYARTDGSQIREAVFSLDGANGVGLSPDENTVYVADSGSARLWGFSLAGPGEIKGRAATSQRNFVAGLAGYQFFDSLAVDSAGHICVATISKSGITRISPDGSEIAHVPTDDVMTTNICFGGEKLGTAYITLSSTGRLVATEWAVPGLPLNFLNT